MNSTVGEQLSMFGLKLTPNHGTDREMTKDIHEITEPPKELMGNDKHRK